MAYSWNLVYLNHRILEICEPQFVNKVFALKSLCYISPIMYLGPYLKSSMKSQEYENVVIEDNFYASLVTVVIPDKGFLYTIPWEALILKNITLNLWSTTDTLFKLKR